MKRLNTSYWIITTICLAGIVLCTIPLCLTQYKSTVKATKISDSINSMTIFVALMCGVSLSLPLFVELGFDFYLKCNRKEQIHWYCRLILLLDLLVPSVIMLIYFHGPGSDQIENFNKTRMWLFFISMRFIARLAIILFYFNYCIQNSMDNLKHSCCILLLFIISRFSALMFLVFPALGFFNYIYYITYAAGTVYFVFIVLVWLRRFQKKIAAQSKPSQSMTNAWTNSAIYLVGMSFEIVTFYIIPYVFSSNGTLTSFSGPSLAAKQFAQVIVTLITCTIPSRYARSENISRQADYSSKKEFKKYISSEIQAPLNDIALNLIVLEELANALQIYAQSEAAQSGVALSTEQEHPPVSSLPKVRSDTLLSVMSGSSDMSRHSAAVTPAIVTAAVTATAAIGTGAVSSEVVTAQAKKILFVKHSCDKALTLLHQLIQHDRLDNGILTLELVYVKLVPFLVATLRDLAAKVHPKLLKFNFDIGCNSELDSVQPRFRDVYVKIDAKYITEVIATVVANVVHLAKPESSVLFQLVIEKNYDSLLVNNMFKLSVTFERHDPVQSNTAKSSPVQQEKQRKKLDTGSIGDDFQPLENQHRDDKKSISVLQSDTCLHAETTKQSAGLCADDVADLSRSSSDLLTSSLSLSVAHEIIRLHDGRLHGQQFTHSAANYNVFNIELPYVKQIIIFSHNKRTAEQDNDDSGTDEDESEEQVHADAKVRGKRMKPKTKPLGLQTLFSQLSRKKVAVSEGRNSGDLNDVE